MATAPPELEKALSEVEGLSLFDDAPDLMGAFREAEIALHARHAHEVAGLLISWLDATAFDAHDREQFIADMIAAMRTGSRDEVRATFAEWRITARALADPVRREILTSEHSSADFDEVERPV